VRTSLGSLSKASAALHRRIPTISRVFVVGLSALWDVVVVLLYKPNRFYVCFVWKCCRAITTSLNMLQQQHLVGMTSTVAGSPLDCCCTPSRPLWCGRRIQPQGAPVPTSHLFSLGQRRRQLADGRQLPHTVHHSTANDKADHAS
jgi:hypothetical protein